ncbi:indoleamine 2,3-dioxygenase 1 [Pelodiscus sinensis]|uniref:indoleamine 2,3-dioxygenase 1 n=1 Tax=Pelodiscus sinensis TaxID=13735 RepID=UPI003F6BA1FB
MESRAHSERLQHLEEFHVSEECGFVLPDPLAQLPDYYAPWTNVAANLPHLVETQQLRGEVAKMPLLSARHLRGHRQLRLAHLALGVITMGYVWQGGGRQPAKILPRVLAVPFCAVSARLGLPPILVYADCVLANWKKRDPRGPLSIGNLDTLFSFPGGDSSKGFFLVSLLVEVAATPGLQAIPTIVKAVLRQDLCSVHTALQDVALAICRMQEAFTLIHEHVDPGLFFRTLRIYLAGWKDSSLMPEGLVYEGVWEAPRQFSGGSAAQSSTLQCFDILLGIPHSTAQGFSAEYLRRMRDYMPAAHRAFIQTLASGPSLRQFALVTGDAGLRAAFNQCVAALAALRSYHIQVVTKYITIPAGRCRAEQQLGGCVQEGVSVRSDMGTGGTDFMRFLKAIRDSTHTAQLTD